MMFDHNFFKDPKGFVERSASEIENLYKVFKEIDFQSLFVGQEEHMRSIKEFFGEDFSTEDFEKRLSSVIERVLNDGITFKDAFGLSEENMEAFYFLAFDLFRNERYANAFQIFKVLSIMDPFNWRYIYALATTMHRQRNYDDAIRHYLLASTMDPERHSPLPHYHCADCYIALNDLNSAVLALGIAMSFCNLDIEEHKELYKRSETLKIALEEKMMSSLKG